MDAEQHGDARARQSAEDVHHLRRVGAVQPGGGLVQEHDPRAGEQLGGDGDSTFLAPAEPAGELVPDETLRHLHQPQLPHPPRHHPVRLAPSRIRRQSQRGVEHQVLPNRRRPGQHVRLLHVPARVSHLPRSSRLAVEPDGPVRHLPARGPAGEKVEQRRLARARRAEDRKQPRRGGGVGVGVRGHGRHGRHGRRVGLLLVRSFGPVVVV
mmetsp:Transcript_11399/g.47736  ORF Transcript_11399/g.47736 Transcript_11399/m.47736 type:complete len:210 (+) Transcript_11399:769-1398(+)